MLGQLIHQVCYETLTHKYYERLYDRFLITGDHHNKRLKIKNDQR